MTKKFMAAFCVMMLSACRESSAPADEDFVIEAGQWTDGDRSGLCVANGMDASFVLYDEEGDANCMAEGKIELGDDQELIFVPRGDSACQISVAADGQAVRLTSDDEACSYYCGSGIELGGRSLMRSEASEGPLADAAGEDIC